MPTEYNERVKEEAFGRATPEDKTLLHADLDRWYQALIEIKREIELQNTSRKAAMLDLWNHSKKQHAIEYAEYLKWAKAAGRVKLAVEQALPRVRALCKERNRADSIKHNEARYPFRDLVKSAVLLVPRNETTQAWHEAAYKALNAD